MQVALVYRSPNVSQAVLITFLCRLLNHVSVSNMPCAILGDFNEDLMHQQNSRLICLMSDCGFTQSVQSPTTAQASLLDHIYYKNPSRSIAVQVQDTYYSDHDTIYCSIPLNDI